jgi:hypothetical protein
VWVFNTTSGIWTFVDGSTVGEKISSYGQIGDSTDIPPSGRSSPYTIYFNDSYVWFYGGAQLNVYYNFFSDMLLYNTSFVEYKEDLTIVSITTGSEVTESIAKNSSNVGAIVAGVIVPIVVIAGAVAGFFMWRRRRLNKMVAMTTVTVEKQGSQYNTLSQLQTKGLSPIVIGEMLGQGNFGTPFFFHVLKKIGNVYKGLWNQVPVALKNLKDSSQFAQFQKEADLLW